MKKEFLFRGQVKYNGNHLFTWDWVYGSLIVKSNGTFIYIIEEDTLGNILREYDVEVIPETIGQFIGFTDKNGVKIFERDIVKSDWGYGSTPKIVDIEEFYYAKLECTLSEDIEVIGNMYENSELLK